MRTNGKPTGCARKFFGSEVAPVLPYTRDNMSELARQVIRTSASVTGVQAKMSLDVNRGGRNEPAKFTIVGLWGKYIFKPLKAQSILAFPSWRTLQ